jgi:hypothetical protein
MKLKMFSRLFLITVIVLMLGVGNLLFSQEEQIGWKRSSSPEPPELHLFHSTQSLNLPTAETLQKGNFEFEISHRFIPTIQSGIKKLFGFDGPVNMRIALGYAVTNKLVVTLGRSNLNDNLDFWAKYKAIQIQSESFPVLIGVRGGVAWNTDVPGHSAGESKNFQYYAQLIFNTLYDKRLGIGIVPSYLCNSYIFYGDNQYSFTIGGNLQFYLTRVLSLLFEFNSTVTGFRTIHNPVAFGFELETGGHFFKILLTNSASLNPSQFLAGADLPFNGGEWRLGFNITRLLTF